MRFSVSEAVVVPQFSPSSPYGIVPFEGMPDYAHFRRWNRDKLGPLPGISTSVLSEDWEFPEGDLQIVDGKYWYGGVVDSHFGHFVTESITRSWWHLANVGHGRKAVFIPRTRRLKTWQKDIFSYLGIEDIHFVERSTRFKNLIIPEQGALLFSSVHEENYQILLSEWNQKRQGLRTLNKKIFLSRPRGTNFGLIGESILARCFENAGYEVFNPEEHSIEVQLAVLRSASHVVGVQGSAFHIFNLLGKSPDTQILMFQRLNHFSSNSFVKTVKPYVGKIKIVIPKLRFSSGIGSNYDSVIPNLNDLKASVEAFDPSVNIDPYCKDLSLKEMINFLGDSSESVEYSAISKS